MIIIGIDPGASGGIASLQPGQPTDGAPEIETLKLTVTERDVSDFLGVRAYAHAYAYIERVHSMPKQGVASSFKFGVSYGFLRGLLIGLEIPFEEVTPQRWQKAMGCLTHGDKNVSKARAQQLFPGIKITHAIADSLLIAEYGRRLRSGELNGKASSPLRN